MVPLAHYPQLYFCAVKKQFIAIVQKERILPN